MTLREQIRASKRCGCFYCLRRFPPSAIRRHDWLNDAFAVHPLSR